MAYTKAYLVHLDKTQGAYIYKKNISASDLERDGLVYHCRSVLGAEMDNMSCQFCHIFWAHLI